MAIAATHTGTCQLCGKRHMLPGGVLAKHGYTVDFGYFNGTCHGSDELPFEVSKDVAEASLAKAAARRDELLAKADAVSLTGNEDGTVWVAMRRKGANTGKTVTSWERVRFVEGVRHMVVAEDGLKQQHGFYGDANAIVRQLQQRYADVMFRSPAKQADMYIAWQGERCAKWAPADLVPVESEDAKKTHVLRYRDGSGYVTNVYGSGFRAVAYKSEDLAKAKRYTERGAKQVLGKLRGYKTLEVVAL